ncbi:SUV3 domain-containing protein [Salinarimonas soli]|uniref:Helicase n=1 Tax=Salinarimonas soli TaxID=1638099 RepID=A0A5B2VGQ0_9HYPH|nr:SUV3 C-terminal domain-containing protein [Salinarimonas soli]KAA2237808.1 helicase [Salinarimonas soli]
MGRQRHNLIAQHHLPGILLASESECERWIEAGLIPVADLAPARRWGTPADRRLFDPAVVASLAPEVPLWRERDEAEVRARRGLTRGRPGRDGRGDPTADDAVRHRRELAAAAATESLGANVRLLPPNADGRRAYGALLRLDMEVLPDWTIPLPVEVSVDEPTEIETLVTASSRPSPEAMASAAGPLGTRLLARREIAASAFESAVQAWRDDLDTYLAAYEDDERAAILTALRTVARDLKIIPVAQGEEPEAIGARLRAALDNLRSRATTRRLRYLREAQIREASGYETYAAIFPQARSLGREVLFLAGPTNSGKTHEALRLAAEAETAEILSPLRLLALEHYERLAEAGLAAGMVTGEERIMAEGATHIARTIETLDLGRVVDVCVIDEVQMLGDGSRGWAWTQAIIGAPARLVVLTGAPEAIPLVEHLLAMTGEALQVRILKRKGALNVESAPVEIKDLGAGDAVIAFSRTEIHDLRTRLVKAGRSVATIYGALGPEVRRAEAARFRERDAEVLVATDAIGMGLNIGPLRRVVFSTLAKFDGVRRRPLSAMEIKQIAGRAGRFGHHNVGLVTALSEAGPFRTLRPTIEDALRQEVRLRGKAYVRPNRETVIAASEVLGTERLGQVLHYLGETLVAGHPDLRMADLSEVIGVAGLLDSVPLPILDRLSYAIAPIDARDPVAVDILVGWARQHAGRGWVEAPGFGSNADLVKLEARVKIVTAWLWLSQRYPDVFQDVETAIETRADLNARIEEKLVATSIQRVRGKTAHGAEPERGRGRRKEGRRERRAPKGASARRG